MHAPPDVPAVATFTDEDDEFHHDQRTDDWWETETSWFSFCVPERRLGGWLYTMVRPNIGTVAGGAWVWDDTASVPWEVPYSANFSALPLPAGTSMRDAVFPNGVTQRVVEPRTSYLLGYHDPGLLELDLRFDGIMEPFGIERDGIGVGRHFDQVGRVHGQLVLRGEPITVDCLAIRDRSLGLRPEDRPPHVAYVSATSEGDSFVAVTATGTPGEPVTYGFLRRDGRAVPLVGGSRAVTRDPERGWMTGITMDLVDAEGRHLRATGEPVSRIVLDRRSFIDCNSLVAWELDGTVAWGEDQDCTPIRLWPKPARWRA